MKIRYLVILYTGIILAVMTVCFTAIYRNSQRSLDVLELNGRYQRVLRELAKADADREEAAELLGIEYDCRILLTTGQNYESDVMEAIKRGETLFDYTDGSMLLGKVVFAGEGAGYDGLRYTLMKTVVGMAVFLLAVGYVILGLLYLWYIRPFRKLEFFAKEVSKGNLDMPLKRTKRNYFGAFTESFDMMREELKRARENEYLANISKKELVASLSHDIKTPVATIKAACEVLQVKETRPDTLDKIKVIAGKAELIDQLIGNMFHATLEELEVLAVQPVEVSSQVVTDMLTELREYGKIDLQNEIPSCLIWADVMRLNQVIDNIVNNAYKYAGTAVTVSFHQHENGISVKIKDNGPGVSSEELPLLTGKFYRGGNAEGKDGSGLGLYLAKNFMERMGGDLECYCDNGFVVNLFLKKV